MCNHLRCCILLPSRVYTRAHIYKLMWIVIQINLYRVCRVIDDTAEKEKRTMQNHTHIIKSSDILVLREELSRRFYEREKSEKRKPQER